jgi:spermidine/putrescine-binding protein
LTSTLYILGDADRVRQRVERALLSGDLVQLGTFSAALTAAIACIAERMIQHLSAQVIMAGGDDLLLTVPAGTFDVDILEGLSRDFADETGCTISFGVGTTVEEAYLHLRMAKASGGGTISMVRQL